MHLLLILLLLTGCSDLKKKRTPAHLHGEYVYRKSTERQLTIPAPQANSRPVYPWEGRLVGHHSRITKEFFRCKGNSLNPMIKYEREGKDPFYYRDCSGGDRHGLPLHNGKEFVYPCLIELLNYIQEKTGKKVIITCGHRCPLHNAYADYTPANWSSKHMIGAEVDFYVEGLQRDPQKVISLIQQYYKETPPFKGQESFEKFQRYDKPCGNIATQPWYNKEVFVKLFQPSEGRDVDNQHGYPYICLQVRFDRALGTKVLFDPAQTQNFLRY